jgi:hypothetical protein
MGLVLGLRKIYESNVRVKGELPKNHLSVGIL